MLIKIRFALTGINVIINQIRFDTSWKEAYIWEDFCLQLDGPITRGGGGGGGGGRLIQPMVFFSLQLQLL